MKDLPTRLRSELKYDAGRFYGLKTDQAIGSGVLLSAVPLPLLNESDWMFDTVEGSALVLTHECDIDRENQRRYSEWLLVCPLIPLRQMLDQASRAEIENFLVDIVNRKVNRLMYLPEAPYGVLQHGGAFIYFNSITSVHRDSLNQNKSEIFAELSDYGMRLLDSQLQQHLFRPKSSSYTSYLGSGAV